MGALGIALSGGGNRAALFSLGALLYIHDTGRNRDVTTITSVSGGSLTNAFLSLCRPSFASPNDRNTFEQAVGRFAREISGRMLFWWLAWLVLALVLTVFVGPWLH